MEQKMYSKRFAAEPVEGIVILYRPRNRGDRDKCMRACSDIIIMMMRYLSGLYLPFFRARWLEEEEAALFNHEEEDYEKHT